MTNEEYQLIYDRVAKPLIKIGLPQDDLMPPMLMMGSIQNGEARIAPMPHIHHLMGSGEGKSHLGHAIRATLDKMKTMGMTDSVLALISEMYMKRATKPAGTSHAEAIAEHAGKSLADDPEAIDAVVIFLYHPDGTQRMGMLPIQPGRKLQYEPLGDEHGISMGRLGTGGKMPEGSKAH